MTHIDNIPHIIKNGVTHKNSKNSNTSYISIGDNSIINSRESFITPIGTNLGMYTPFYFGLRTPMLYVIQKGYNGVKMIPDNKIVYCVSSVQKIIDASLNFIYSDGHATDRFTSFYTQEEALEIKNRVDFEATNAKFWKKEDDLDFKRRKEAEFLIDGDVPPELIIGYIVSNIESEKVLIDFGIDEKLIVVRPYYFF